MSHPHQSYQNSLLLCLYWLLTGYLLIKCYNLYYKIMFSLQKFNWLRLHCRRPNRKSQLFCLFDNFLLTWCSSINNIFKLLENIKFILYSTRNRKEKFARGLHFFLFLKLIQINFHICQQCRLYMYMSIYPIHIKMFIYDNTSIK